MSNNSSLLVPFNRSEGAGGMTQEPRRPGAAARGEKGEAVCEAVCVLSNVSTVLGIASIALNIIFLVLMRVSMKDRSSAYHRLVQNLSAADLLASLAFLVTQTWPQGPFAYIEPLQDFLLVEGLPYVFRGLPWMFFTGYLLTLTCMSLNQYVAVCRPWRYAALVTRTVVTRAFVAVWLVSALQIILPLSVLLALYARSHKQDAMTVLFTISTIEIQVWLAIYATSTLVNIAINMAVYRKIRALKRQRRFCSKSSQESHNLRLKQEAFVTVAMLLAASIFCRLPFPIFGIAGINLERKINQQTGVLVNAVLVLLLYINFFADPIIYVLRMKEVQTALKTLLRSCLAAPCCFRPSPSAAQAAQAQGQGQSEYMIGLISREVESVPATSATSEKDQRETPKDECKDL